MTLTAEMSGKNVPLLFCVTKFYFTYGKFIMIKNTLTDYTQLWIILGNHILKSL